MDISEITDISELKVMLADQYINRDQAIATQQQSQQNINALQARLAEVQREESHPAEDTALNKKERTL